jgi:hypothetical protein
MNKFIHALILATFAFACWFLSGILKLSMIAGGSVPPPAFTRLCIGLRPVLVVLPCLAVIYCLYVWFRKSNGKNSWVNFFAVTMSVLVLVTLPSLTAAYLPLVASINHMAPK